MTWLIYPILGFIAVVILAQFAATRRAKRNLGHSAPDTTTVDGDAHSDGRRLYYFHASHCGFCKAMTPLMNRLHETYRNLIAINVENNMELARDFGIAATPSFVLVEDGTIQQVLLGGQTEKQLLNLLRGE